MGKRKYGNPGEKYGKLTIIREVERYVEPSGRKYRMVLCSCDCGSEPIEVRLHSLRSGLTKSCGCYQKEKAKETHKKFNTYDLETYGYGVGYTTKGEEFYFDKEDYDLIKYYTWSINRDGYVVAADVNTKKHLYMHRLVMNAKNGVEIDHKFHMNNDNRKSELREVTSSQNSINRRIKSTNTSGITGVSWYRQTSKWRAYISINGKNINIGYFTTKEEAIEARRKAEIDFHGVFSPNYEKPIQSQSHQEQQHAQ